VLSRNGAKIILKVIEANLAIFQSATFPNQAHPLKNWSPVGANAVSCARCHASVCVLIRNTNMKCSGNAENHIRLVHSIYVTRMFLFANKTIDGS
jgi:hypothetical protein